MPVGTDELAAIDQALAAGVLNVRHSDGRSVTYRSVDELLKAREAILERQAQEAGTRKRRTFRLYQSGKGY